MSLSLNLELVVLPKLIDWRTPGVHLSPTLSDKVTDACC